AVCRRTAAETPTGGPGGPPVGVVPRSPSYLVGALILPAAICLETAVSFAISAARWGAFTLTLPKPTPPFLTVKTPSVPPLNLPSLTSPAVVKTARSTFLVALVRMCVPRYAWSESPPIPQTPISFTDWRAPRRQPPAAAKTTFEPASICVSASSLHFAWSTNSCEEPERNFVLAFVFATPAL